MDWKYFVPIVSIISVIAGWFLNEMSYYFRCRRQDKRKLKEVLFNLLDIWHLMKANNPDLVVQITIDKLTGRFPDAFRNKEALLSWKPFYQDFADGLMQQIVSKEISGSKERYEISVNSLAKIDPLLAHRLSGKLSVHDYIKISNERIENFKGIISNFGTSDDLNALESLKQMVRPIIMDDVTKTMEDDIKEVSCKIGVLTWFKTKRKLGKHDAYILREANKKTDEFLNNIEKLTQSQVTKGVVGKQQ
jgi:hypothetical protein